MMQRSGYFFTNYSVIEVSQEPAAGGKPHCERRVCSLSSFTILRGQIASSAGYWL